MVFNEKLEKYLELQKIFVQKCKKEHTALVIIDMQEYQVRKTGAPYKVLNSQVPGLLDYFVERVERVVEPNLIELITFCREKKIKIIYTKYCSFSQDGSDLNPRYKKMNQLSFEFCNQVAYPPIADPLSEIIPSIKPSEDDIILYKNTSGSFMSTRFETLLNNMGIKNLIITGVVTHFCVESTAREASDLGFNVVIIEDCCAGWSEQMHEHALKEFELLYGNVLSLKKLKRNIV